jgi:hypothetical protein
MEGAEQHGRSIDDEERARHPAHGTRPSRVRMP